MSLKLIFTLVTDTKLNSVPELHTILDFVFVRVPNFRLVPELHTILYNSIFLSIIKRKNRASIARSTVTITQPSGCKIRFSLLPRSAYEAARALFRHKACQGTSHRDQELPGSHGIYAWSCCGLPGRSRSDACG